MSAKPRIFVSAVSKELRSARQRVANALISLGYEPEFLDVFPAEQGDLKAMLRRKIDSCEGLIQLVGQRFGCGPTQPEDVVNAVSYTQFELHHARERGIKTWLLFLADGYPADEPNNEPEAYRLNQQHYRRSVVSAPTRDELDAPIYHEAATAAELENVVLKLRDELDLLRAQWRKHQRRTSAIIATTAAGVLVLLGLVSLVRRDAGQALDTTVRVETKLDQTQLALDEVVRRLPMEGRESENENEETARLAMFSRRERQYGLPAGTIARELPVFARRLAADRSVTTLRRAQGAYATRDYVQAERLALDAVAEARATVPPGRLQLLHALELAGRSAGARRDFERSIAYYAEAASLTDKTKDSAEHARLQQALAAARAGADATIQAPEKSASTDQIALSANDPEIVAPSLREKVAAPEIRPGADVPGASDGIPGEQVQRGEPLVAQSGDSTGTESTVPQEAPSPGEGEQKPSAKSGTGASAAENRGRLAEQSRAAAEMLAEGKAVEAEMEYRKVIKSSEQTLGTADSDTLGHRTQLGLVLSAQHKHAEAEAEHRAVLKIRERLLGPRHADTLSSRSEVASALFEQGKFGEAEREHRALVRLRTEVLGPRHADTLFSRSRVGSALHARRFFPEAEEEHRAVLEIREKELGPEHPDTLQSRNGLAAALVAQSKSVDAEAQIRLVLGIRERNLGSDDTNTLSSRASLGNTLFAQARYADAEREYRTVIRIRERLPVSQDFEVLRVRNFLACALDAQRKDREAEREYQAIVEARQSGQGPQHPDTLRSMHDLAVYLESQRNFEAALDWASQAARGARTALGPTNPVTRDYDQHEQKLKARR